MKPVTEYENTEKLIEHLKKGEEKAYVFLVDKFHRRLFAYAHTLIHDHAAAEDIVQNVFLKTWQYRDKLNSKYSIQSFLFSAVYNQFVNTYKKDKSTILLELKYHETMYDVVDKMDESTLERLLNIVTREIEKLPPKCRQVFTLSKKEGLTNKEIADYMDISVKAVEAQITKGFNILRKELGEKYELIVLYIKHFCHNEDDKFSIKKRSSWQDLKPEHNPIRTSILYLNF
ncbi:RNA polymerase sigma factor [Sinomicrobium weinanense]|uniref:RNA polymerase sigma-70 factor n=1 Tax=Sinomicrobium weinanense TaxID=2842200 RepID=A0A926JS79_9FLAO|nr:RNA polymerase sigma-70 factor [Sinomicrobium weinanense]MBC9796426.1 RNA polymerase sigma-70 factor [Sinomicrobium weinanense]MBU3125900.1 RNA polymerase sigma-70 factor [Sinomicrobium weinanense]